MDEDQNLASLFANLNTISAQAMGGDRSGGGTGGGSLDTLGNMDPNPLIALNPYLSKNVTSFNYGGKYKVPKYDNGGYTTDDYMMDAARGDTSSPEAREYIKGGMESIKRHGRQPPSTPFEIRDGGVYLKNTPDLNRIIRPSLNRTNIMLDPSIEDIQNWRQSWSDMYGTHYDNGGVFPIEEGIDWGSRVPTGRTGAQRAAGDMTMHEFVTGGSGTLDDLRKASRSSQTGLGQSMIGQYEQQANQMIALNQLGNVFKGLQRRNTMPIANKGMKMRKRYTQGGRF